MVASTYSVIISHKHMYARYIKDLLAVVLIIIIIAMSIYDAMIAYVIVLDIVYDMFHGLY